MIDSRTRGVVGNRGKGGGSVSVHSHLRGIRGLADNVGGAAGGGEGDVGEGRIVGCAVPVLLAGGHVDGGAFGDLVLLVLGGDDASTRG